MSINKWIKKMEWNGIEYCAHSLSHVQLFATPWTVAHQARISQARILEQVAFSFRESSRPRDQAQISCTGKWILYHCPIWEASMEYSVQFSSSVVSDSLQLHELQHARPPCPSPTPTPGVHLNSRPSSQ